MVEVHRPKIGAKLRILFTDMKRALPGGMVQLRVTEPPKVPQSSEASAAPSRVLLKVRPRLDFSAHAVFPFWAACHFYSAVSQAVP